MLRKAGIAAFVASGIIYGTFWPNHSGLMPANLIILPHLSASSDMNFPKAADVIGIGSAPKANSRAFIVGSARIALISLLSLSMIAAGVSLGAPSPYQPIASY